MPQPPDISHKPIWVTGASSRQTNNPPPQIKNGQAEITATLAARLEQIPQLQVLLQYFNIVLRAGHALSCLRAVVRKQSRENRSILFSAAAWRKHVSKLCWNIPSLRPGCWILVPLMEIVYVSWQYHEFSYLPCSLPCPAPSSSWEGPSLWVFPALWQGRRQSHKHIFTPSLPNTHGMTIKLKHMLQLILISFSYCLMAMSLPQSQVPSSRGIGI